MDWSNILRFDAYLSSVVDLSFTISTTRIKNANLTNMILCDFYGRQVHYILFLHSGRSTPTAESSFTLLDLQQLFCLSSIDLVSGNANQILIFALLLYMYKNIASMMLKYLQNLFSYTLLCIMFFLLQRL